VWVTLVKTRNILPQWRAGRTVTVQGAVTVSAPSNVMVQVKAAGPDTIDAGSNEDSGGLIAGAIVGCLALVAALGAGGFYCYKKKTPPPPPANVQVVLHMTDT
jgi:hypothetical protein